MSRPSAWSRVLSGFWSSITNSPAKAKRYVGEDKWGNKFYEFSGRGHGSNVKRGYDPGNDPNLLPSLEWDAWMKGSRRFPPSDQEIEINRAKQQNQLEQNSINEKRAPNISSTGKGAADIDRPKQFPTYNDDFELVPGGKKSDK